MKYLYKLKYVLLVMLLLILFYYAIKENSVTVNVISPIEKITKMKEILYNILNHMIHDERFINTYGRSKLSPIFITHYYYLVICDPQFIHLFLDSIPLKELIETYSNKELFLQEIQRLFYRYVEHRQSEFENTVRQGLRISFLINSIVLFKEILFTHQDVLTTLQDVANNVDIITPIESLKLSLLTKKALGSVGLVIGMSWLSLHIAKAVIFS